MHVVHGAVGAVDQHGAAVRRWGLHHPERGADPGREPVLCVFTDCRIKLHSLLILTIPPRACRLPTHQSGAHSRSVSHFCPVPEHVVDTRRPRRSAVPVRIRLGHERCSRCKILLAQLRRIPGMIHDNTLNHIHIGEEHERVHHRKQQTTFPLVQRPGSERHVLESRRRLVAGRSRRLENGRPETVPQTKPPRTSLSAACLG